MPVRRVSFGSVATSRLSVSVADWLQHYRSPDQLDAQGITQTNVHFSKKIRREIDNDVSAAITWILAFYDCPYGFTH